MSCGTPVVAATDVGGVKEVVDHGVSGWLSAMDDLGAFVTNVKHALFDGDLARRYGEAARRIAVERFRSQRRRRALRGALREDLGRRSS